MPTIRFQDAIEGKGFWGHFDGSAPRHVPVGATGTTAGKASISTQSTATPTPDEEKAIEEWERKERAPKLLLTQKLPDGTLMRIHKESMPRRTYARSSWV